MKKLLLTLMLSCSAWSAVISQTLTNTGGVNPGFALFTIDGVTGQRLLCDQFFPNITSNTYTSLVYGLADLTSTSQVALIRAGNTLAQALEKYKLVALLDRFAYANPSNAADVVLANRRIVDGSGPTTANSDALLLLAQAQALTTTIAQLSDFRIYNSPLNLQGTAPITQEMTGIIGGTIPEPGTMLLLGAGLAGIAMYRRRQN